MSCNSFRHIFIQNCSTAGNQHSVQRQDYFQTQGNPIFLWPTIFRYVLMGSFSVHTDVANSCGFLTHEIVASCVRSFLLSPCFRSNSKSKFVPSISRCHIEKPNKKDKDRVIKTNGCMSTTLSKASKHTKRQKKSLYFVKLCCTSSYCRLRASFTWPNNHCAVGEHGVVEAVQEHGLQLVAKVDVSDSCSVAAEHVWHLQANTHRTVEFQVHWAGGALPRRRGWWGW